MRDLSTIRLKDFLTEMPKCPVCNAPLYGASPAVNKYAINSYTCVSDLDYLDHETGDLYMFESFQCVAIFKVSPWGYTPSANIKDLLYADTPNPQE